VLTANSGWTNRLLIAVPFAIAALLNALMVGVEYLHLRLDYVARYGFAFSGPWAWLVNIADISNRLNFQTPWLRQFIFYVAFLWIPAVLYSVCVWFLLVALRIAARPLLNRLAPDVLKTFKRRTAIASSIAVVAGVSWFALRLCREQIACNKRSAAFALRVESIKHDANEKLSVGTKSGDISRFFAEHGIRLQVIESEAFGTLYTEGCGPLGCGTDSALIGVRVKLDSAGAVTEKPTVVGMYTDCL
jgi:hypothetical protein